MSLSSSCCCPLCYKAVAGNESDPEGGSSEDFAWRGRRREVQQRFFRLLERYLGHVGDEDGGGGGSPLQVIRLEQLTEIGMLPCTDCFQVMESFCDKFQELEAIHLALRGKIWILKGIMEGVQGPVSSSRLKYFPECAGKLLPGSGSSGHGDPHLEQAIEAINKSKRELIEKCVRKVTGASPQVSMTKLESPQSSRKSKSRKRSGLDLQDPVHFTATHLMTTEFPSGETDDLNGDDQSWNGEDEEGDGGEQSPPPTSLATFGSGGPVLLEQDSLLEPDPEIKIERDPDQPPSSEESLPIPDIEMKVKRKPMKKEKRPKPLKITKKAIQPESETSGRRSLRQGSKQRCSQCWKGFPTMKDLRLHTKECHCQEEDSSEDEAGMTSLLKPEAEAASDTESLIHFSDEYDEVYSKAEPRLGLGSRYSIGDPQLEVKDKIYNCKDCDRSFRSQQGLREHRLKMHVGLDMTFPCPLEKCPLLFETNEELVKHMKRVNRRHSSLENPVKKPALESLLCPKCGKTCAGSGRLLSHLKYHERVESDGFVCETCGKTFKTKKALEKHLPFHDGGPGVWRFTCGVCSKKCLTRWKLNCHMRTHTGERPFVCEVCGSSYRHEYTLTSHIRREHVPKKRNKTELAEGGGMEVQGGSKLEREGVEVAVEGTGGGSKMVRFQLKRKDSEELAARVAHKYKQEFKGDKKKTWLFFKDEGYNWTTISRWIKKAEESGGRQLKVKTGRPPKVMTLEMIEAVKRLYERHPSISDRQAAKKLEMNKSTLSRIKVRKLGIRARTIKRNEENQGFTFMQPYDSQT